LVVYAVIVTFNPDAGAVQELAQTLRASGAKIIVVDNTPGAGAENLPMDATVLRLGFNAGIAHAQNVGIRAALAHGAEVIVFFDQDSRLEGGFLDRLLRPLFLGEPGVVAPVCVDRAHGFEVPSYRITRYGFVRKVFARTADRCVDADLVIASGTAATAATFAVAGVMDEDLFIDYVDFEWCLRCRSKGIPIRVVPGATITHSIGERAVNLGLFSGVIHSSARSYYKIRNGFLLLRKKHVPWFFAVRETTIAIVQYMAMLPFVKRRREYAAVFVRAISHGIRGVVGINPASLRGASRAAGG
jgi:rhamnosyltransferase